MGVVTVIGYGMVSVVTTRWHLIASSLPFCCVLHNGIVCAWRRISNACSLAQYLTFILHAAFTKCIGLSCNVAPVVWFIACWLTTTGVVVCYWWCRSLLVPGAWWCRSVLLLWFHVCAVVHYCMAWIADDIVALHGV